MAAPFAPFGKSITIAVTTTGSTPVTAGSSGDLQANAYRLANLATVPVYLTWGNSTMAAAVIGAVGMLSGGLWLSATSVEVLTFAPGSYFSAICGSGSGMLCISVGDGL